MKGQTWVEFIVATSIFLLSIGFIFITASGNLKEEIQKSQQQASCLKAYELENFLRQPGAPADWTFPSGFSIFGLSGNNTPLVIQNDKWQGMKSFGFANISQNSTPSQSWHVSYDVYAFEFDPAISDSSCTTENAITLCRNSGSYLNITANSTSQSQTKLKLFLPFSSATLIGLTNESDDVANATSANGTSVILQLNTNSTDEDSVSLHLLATPNLIFIEQFNVESGQYLPFYLGNISLQDSFGPFAPPNAMICDTKVSGLLNLTTENLLVNFNLEGW